MALNEGSAEERLTPVASSAASHDTFAGSPTSTQTAIRQVEPTPIAASTSTARPLAVPSTLVSGRIGPTDRIAFVSNRDGDWDVYVTDESGREASRLTQLREVNGRPSWSPDGRQLAFASFVRGSFEVFVVNADGGDLVQLTNGPAVDWEPWWSPDGQRLVFTTFRDGEGALYTMNPDGTEARRLTSELGAWVGKGSDAVVVGVQDHFARCHRAGSIRWVVEAAGQPRSAGGYRWSAP